MFVVHNIFKTDFNIIAFPKCRMIYICNWLTLTFINDYVQNLEFQDICNIVCISEICRLSRLFYYKNQHCITNLVIKQFWLLCCLFFFDIRIVLTLLISSSSSCTKNSCRPVHLKQPPINIRVVNCVKDRSPQRSPNLNVCVMLLIISALDRHDNAWINRATLIYWTAYEAILLFDEICFPMNLLSPFFCVNCKLKNVERLCRCAWLPRTTCDCASSNRCKTVS